ncbi:hypothetical protein [Streptomyces sp. DH24]|uniref:hypothetical protein n=1 Tax=Streptomyces sp. DH24 TaxID=3040123 RepID=UPI0024427ADC|nr:hypothetical protein [Streptomyces sp. DH24]MDG9716916.1 hypothetical protein [Streptomyces sp. DH24]
MPTSETTPQPSAVAGVSMRDLLASCAAAQAVSTPPRAPEPGGTGEPRPSGRTLPPVGHREAA